MNRQYSVAVATSDKLEQVIILGKGAMRLSARDLKKEIKETSVEIKTVHLDTVPSQKNWLFDHVDADLFEYLEDIRLNRREGEKPSKPSSFPSDRAAGTSKGKKKKKRKKS